VGEWAIWEGCIKHEARSTTQEEKTRCTIQEEKSPLRRPAEEAREKPSTTSDVVEGFAVASRAPQGFLQLQTDFLADGEPIKLPLEEFVNAHSARRFVHGNVPCFVKHRADADDDCVYAVARVLAHLHAVIERVIHRLQVSEENLFH